MVVSRFEMNVLINAAELSNLNHKSNGMKAK